MNLRPASKNDISKLVELINLCYRGEFSKKGWTTEAELLAGQRIDHDMALSLFDKHGSSFFVYEHPNQGLVASVHIQETPDSLYFGMLTVHPEYQGQKLGRKILDWVEERARKLSKPEVELDVITARKELIAYYERRGYEKTEKVYPFPEDPRYGIPQKGPLELQKYKKTLAMSPDNIAIDLQGLARTYKSYKKSEGVWNSIRGLWNREYIEVPALKPTTFQIPQGQIVGLVGANGAGKTTLLKTLSGLIHPTSGKAQVLGFTPWERKNDFLRQISLLLGQKNQLWWDISPADSFELLAKIYDIDHTQAKKRVQELSTILNCTHVLNIQLRRLSLGERMKMELIGALLHQPKILFLDEPTIGLDIVAQNSIRKFLENYVREHRPTIILTSHYMDDITELADRLLLMSKGSLVYDGSVTGFINNSSKSKNEEVDFESVIHEFLEKESRV